MVVRVGVIGAGNMGGDHARTLSRFVSGAEVVLLADPDLQRATAAAGAAGCGAVDDPIALVNATEVDAVVIASPDATHPALVRACVEAGKPVLCEKPMTLRAGDAAALFELATSRELLLMEAMWTGRSHRSCAYCRPVATRPAYPWRDAAAVGRSCLPAHQATLAWRSR